MTNTTCDTDLRLGGSNGACVSTVCWVALPLADHTNPAIAHWTIVSIHVIPWFSIHPAAQRRICPQCLCPEMGSPQNPRADFCPLRSQHCRMPSLALLLFRLSPCTIYVMQASPWVQNRAVTRGMCAKLGIARIYVEFCLLRVSCALAYKRRLWLQWVCSCFWRCVGA